jgi:hypothetical protein
MRLTRLEADDLLAILSGCLSVDPQPLQGRTYAGGWSAVDLAGGVTAYLRREGKTWRICAGTRERLTIEYAGFDQDRPRRVRLRTAGDGFAEQADLALELSQSTSTSPSTPGHSPLWCRPVQPGMLFLRLLRKRSPLPSA